MASPEFRGYDQILLFARILLVLIKTLVILPLAFAALPAAAQVIGEPIPGQSTAKARAKPWNAGSSSRPCPEYGPGFVRLQSGTACVRVGGSVAVEYGVGSRGRTGSAASGAVRLETRDETSFGPLRTVVQARGRIDRGLESSPYGYR